VSPVAAEVVVADFEVSKTRSIFEGPWEWVHLGYLLAFSGWNGSSSTLSTYPYGDDRLVGLPSRA